jgi:protein-tyrosine kinase
VDMSDSPPRPSPGMTPKRDRSIGALLVDSRNISPADAEAVVRYAKKEGLRFGDAAVKLGLVVRQDVERALARQFDYPYLSHCDESLSRELIAAYAPFSPQVEAMRALRTQLILRWFNGNPPRRLLAVVGASRGEGRSYLAANLAVVFSQQGARTLLVDADLRNPRQHAMFKLSDRLGLSSLLARRGDEIAIHRIRGLPGLSVLPAGTVPPNPLELLTRPELARILADLTNDYGVIIIDTPAAAIGADYQGIAAVAEGVLLVTHRNVTRAADARGVAASITATATTVAGVVLNEH